MLRKDRGMDGQMDRLTYEGHFYNPPSASQPGINNAADQWGLNLQHPGHPTHTCGHIL